MATFRDPHNVSHGSTAATGCVSIDASDGSAPSTSISDAGTKTIFLVKGPVTGTINFDDALQADGIENITTAASLTFDILDDANTQKTVTITNCKTGGVRNNFGRGAGSASVPFVGDAMSIA